MLRAELPGSCLRSYSLASVIEPVAFSMLGMVESA